MGFWIHLYGFTIHNMDEIFYPSAVMMTVLSDPSSASKSLTFEDLSASQKEAILSKMNVDEDMIDESLGYIVKAEFPSSISGITAVRINGSEPDPWEAIILLDGDTILSFASYVQS
mgnify:CR=1 FL=1